MLRVLLVVIATLLRLKLRWQAPEHRLENLLHACAVLCVPVPYGDECGREADA